MWGAIASAVASLAGTAASGIMSAKNNQRREQELKRERGASNRYYNEQRFQDPTKRYDYVRTLNQMRQNLKRSNAITDAKRTIMGGTQEYALANRQYGANAIADATENVAAQQARRGDLLSSQQRSEDRRYDAMRMGMLDQRDQTYNNMAINAGNAFNGFSPLDNKQFKPSQETAEYYGPVHVLQLGEIPSQSAANPLIDGSVWKDYANQSQYGIFGYE